MLSSPIFVVRTFSNGLISPGLGGQPTLPPFPSIVRQSTRSPNRPRFSLERLNGRPPSRVAGISPPLNSLINAQGDQKHAKADRPQCRGPILAERRRLCKGSALTLPSSKPHP